MKLKFSGLAAMMVAFFVFTVTSVQADTATPDILSSVSPELVQTLTKAESAETRGEYWQTIYFFDGSSSISGFQYSSNPLPSFEVISNGFITRTYLGGSYVSR